ncbi:MAG: lipooligosaccharide transport system permease protein [Actinomycetota bacterium]|nr:lipooligosaccharide transport system permease protein [Actinomycetota bacterium]
MTAALRASSIYFVRIGRSGRSTVLVALLNPLFVLGAMGVGLGSLVKDHSSLGGIDYVTFIAPALLAAFAMQAAAGASLWPVLGGIKWEGTYLAQVSSPLRPFDVLLGQLTYTTADIAMRVITTFVAMVVFGAVESWWGLLAIPVAIVTGFAYAAPLTAFASTQETDSAFPLIFRLGIIPSYLFSGTFFPVSQLPSGLRLVAKVTPLWHGVDLCRSLSLGTATVGGALAHVLYLSLFCVGSLWWARRTFDRRLHR